jgi:hypothetical protein
MGALQVLMLLLTPQLVDPEDHCRVIGGEDGYMRLSSVVNCFGFDY